MIFNEKYLSVQHVMLVPEYNPLSSEVQVSLDPFIYSAPEPNVTGIELAARMLELGEFAVVDQTNKEEWKAAIRQYYNNPKCFFSVTGLDSVAEFLKVLEEIDNESTIDSNIKVSVAINLEHGDCFTAKQTIAFLKKQSFVGNIMSGAIFTPDAALRSIEWGVTHLRVGSSAEDMLRREFDIGVGFPLLSAVFEISKVLATRQINNIEIIVSDWYEQNSRAIKYFAAGATAIMLGGDSLNRTKESAGWISKSKETSEDNPKLYKIQNYVGEEEGYEIFPSSDAETTISKFRKEIKTAMNYLGANKLSDLNSERVKFIKI